MAKICGRKLRRNKKGSLLDILFMAFVLMFFAIVVLIGLRIGDAVKDQINSIDGATADSIDATTRTIDNYRYTINNSFLFLTVLMGLTTLVLAALVRIHPIFIPFYFIGLVIVIFMSGVFSNIYQSMAQGNAELIAVAESLSYMNNIMIMLPFIVGIFGFILMVIMYKIWSVQQV